MHSPIIDGASFEPELGLTLTTRGRVVRPSHSIGEQQRRDSCLKQPLLADMWADRLAMALSDFDRTYLR